MNSIAQENTALRPATKWLLGVGIYIAVVCGLHFGAHVAAIELFGLSLLPAPCYWMGIRQAKQEAPCNALYSAFVWGLSLTFIVGPFLHYLFGMPSVQVLEVSSSATFGYFFGWRRISN